MQNTIKQFFSYGAVGVLNTILNLVIMNTLMAITGITRGFVFLAMSFGTFCIVVLHSFLWNRYLVFRRDNPHELHREYIAFFSVTTFTAILGISVLHLLVNVIGAPSGISGYTWANIAILMTIPLSVACNFLGYKFLVFTERR